MRGLAMATLCVCIGVALPIAPTYGAYESRGKRDPFVPLLTEDGQKVVPPGLDEGEATDLTLLDLQGIMFDPNAESYAVINGQVVREREAIGNVQILKIEPTEVTIRVDGQEKRLTVPQTSEEIR